MRAHTNVEQLLGVTRPRPRVSGGVLEPAPLRAAIGSNGLTDLGVSPRARWRADDALWTRSAERRWAHGRRLVDVVRDLGARGDRVLIEVAGRSFDGTVAAVGDDRVDVDTTTALVSIRTAFGDSTTSATSPISVRCSSPGLGGGRRTPPALATFRARLLELERLEVTVRIGTFVSDREHVGTLVVGLDQVLVRGGADWLLPTCWVGYVVIDAGVES